MTKAEAQCTSDSDRRWQARPPHTPPPSRSHRGAPCIRLAAHVLVTGAYTALGPLPMSWSQGRTLH